MNNRTLNMISGILLVILVLFTGCQVTPGKEAVVSKNNDGFNADTAVVADEPETSGEMQRIEYQSSFDSTDESVHYVMNIAETLSGDAMPLVLVSPHYLTEEDAERVAHAIFPEAVFYEADPLLAPVLTKDEIRKKISLWSQYTSVPALEELYGEEYGEDYLVSTAKLVKQFIEDYTASYETAPENDANVLCEWTMRKSAEYVYAAADLAEIDLNQENDEISAQCYNNGVPYYYTATTRNKSDFKVNMLSCVIFGGQSPRSIEDRILYAKLCRTAEPTAEQIQSVKEKAEQMLSDMNLGEWYIDEVNVVNQSFGDQVEYNIFVNAVPVFNGIPALRCQQLQSLRNEEGYAASQYITDANFNFSANGELITFRLFTPLDLDNLVYEHVKTMDVKQLLVRAEEALTLTDAYAYSFGSYLPMINEEMQCNITVSEMEYGLSRVKVQDQEDSFYYVPAIMLKGNIEYSGKQSGKVYYESDTPEILLHINAVDGSIINQTNS